MLWQSLNIFIFQLSSSKLSSVLAGLSAFKSEKNSCVFVFGFGFGYSPLSQISEFIRALLIRLGLFVIRHCVLRTQFWTFTLATWGCRLNIGLLTIFV